MGNGLSVALCTFNGVKYLRQQLKSIFNQTRLPDEIFICDDASTDLTVDVAKALVSESQCPIKITENKSQLGVIANYAKVISMCSGDYVALCDQDDIWLPEKLAISLEKIKQAEKLYGTNIPLLVYSDLSVIDEVGEVIAPSFMKLRRLRPEPAELLKTLLAQNYVTGCTCLINRFLIEAALPIPESAVMHDWWLSLVAAATGKIIYIPAPTVQYRKHGNNVIGAKGFYSDDNLARLFDMSKLEKEMAATIKQAYALQERLKHLPATDNYPYLDRYLIAASKGGLKALPTLINTGIRKNGLLRNFLFYLLLVKGGHKDAQPSK